MGVGSGGLVVLGVGGGSPGGASGVQNGEKTAKNTILGARKPSNQRLINFCPKNPTRQNALFVRDSAHFLKAYSWDPLNWPKWAKIGVFDEKEVK